MKRFLLLFCTVVLIGAIMIVPAFAAESFTVHFSEASHGSIEADPLSLNGWYLTVSVESYTGTSYTFDPIQLTFAPSSEARNTVDLNVNGVNFGVMTYWAELDGDIYFALDRFPYDPYEADTTLTFTPTTPPVVDEPDSDITSPIADIGEFFSSVMLWLASLASVVVNSPVLNVLVFCFVIVGFVVSLGKRLKS